MNKTIVDSSNIAAIGYDANSQTLEVEFLNGSIYQYYAVPQYIYDGLMSADSHGKYFDANVKKEGYAYKRIS